MGEQWFNLVAVFAISSRPAGVAAIQAMLATVGMVSSWVVINLGGTEVSVGGDVDEETLLDIIPNVQEAVGTGARLLSFSLTAVDAEEESYVDESRNPALA